MQCSNQPAIRCAGASLVILLIAGLLRLPTGGERTASTAMQKLMRIRSLRSRAVTGRSHPSQSGLHSLPDGRDALAARIALVDAAQRSLDLQGGFIWNQDPTGKVLLEHLIRAADRGVRVRLLLDDIGTMPTDAVLL